MAATPELVVDCRSALLENALWVPETGLCGFWTSWDRPCTATTRRRRRHAATSSAAPSPWVVCVPADQAHQSFLLARREGVFRVDPSSFAMTFWTDPNAR